MALQFLSIETKAHTKIFYTTHTLKTLANKVAIIVEKKNKLALE